ncbi:MAG: hypothetical protein ABSG84_15905 [Acidobacteriaceae bacterium]|jgi:hypothetical protein
MDGSAERDEIGGDYEDSLSSDKDATEVILLELERILNSRPFRSSGRSKQFLSYVVRNSLDGHLENLKERTIGTEVFERDPNYATGDDPVVRVNAGEVRRRLEQYYYGAPIDTPVRIGIPLGSYIPEFHWTSRTAPEQSAGAAVAPAPGAEGHGESSLIVHEKPAEPEEIAVPLAEPRAARSRATSISHQRYWMLAGMIVLAIGCTALWLQNRAMQRSFYPWRYEPSVSALWSEVLDARPDTDVVIADSSFSLVQLITKKSFTFQDYLSRSYINQLQTPGMSAEMSTALNLIAVKHLGNSSDFRLAARILALDPRGKNIHLYYAREYMPALLKQDNVILIGSSIANPWAELFESRMNFTVKSNGDTPTYIVNRSPASGEQSIYSPTDSVGYCTVAYLANPDHNGSVLLLEGTGSEATEAAGDFLLSEDQLSNFEKMLHTAKLPYFEVLLKTSQVRGTPLSTSLVAYRVY